MKVYIHNTEDLQDDFDTFTVGYKTYVEVKDLNELLRLLATTLIAIEIGDDNNSFREIE